MSQPRVTSNHFRWARSNPTNKDSKILNPPKSRRFPILAQCVFSPRIPTGPIYMYLTCRNVHAPVVDVNQIHVHTPRGNSWRAEETKGKVCISLMKISTNALYYLAPASNKFTAPTCTYLCIPMQPTNDTSPYRPVAPIG
jgi:hypothetical protein